jgi:hypothetical protein
MDVDLQQVGPVSHPSLMSETEWDEDVVMSPVGKSQQSTPTLTPSPYTMNAVIYGPQPRPMNGMAQVQQAQVPQAHIPPKVKNSKKSGVGGGNRSGGSTPSDNHLVEVPAQLFYPFYPETQVGSMPQSAQNGGGSAISAGSASAGSTSASVTNTQPSASVTMTAPAPAPAPVTVSASANGNAHRGDYSGLLAAAAAAQDYGYQSQDSFVSEERDPKLSVHHQGMMWVNAVSWVCRFLSSMQVDCVLI